VYSGEIGLHDVLGLFDRFEGDFRAHPDHFEVCDGRDVTKVAITDREFTALLALVIGIYRRNDCRKRIAFLGGDGPAGPVFDRAVARFAADLPIVQCASFDNVPQALDYVGLPHGYSLRRALH